MNLKSDRSGYTPIDFLDWRASGTLSLTPKFQRRHVWTTPARSFLIDTLLLGMPIPPIFIRIVQSPVRDKIIREVIDGQQRIKAILGYIDGEYALSKNIESPFSGKRFNQLPKEEQDKIMQYSFICEVFHGLEDRHVLSIFARLNTHSVKLNAQELRNGRYFGHFKQLAYGLAFDHLEFWKKHNIFTDSRIARMAEVELTSELIVAGMGGLQDKKSSIDDYYEDYDETFSERGRVKERFEKTIDTISESCGDFLSGSEFRRTPIFYTLYTVVFHRLFGLPRCDLATPKRGRVSTDDLVRLSNAVRDLSEIIRQARTDEEFEVPTRLQTFITACSRQTDNVKPRLIRFSTLYNRAYN